MILQNRKLTRLKGYDYSQNEAYFITICTHNRKCILSEILVGQLKSYTSNKFDGMLWHRSFHNHIIRGDKIWEYMDTNVIRRDFYNAERTR